MPLSINLHQIFKARLVERERMELKKGRDPEAVFHTLYALANEFNK